MKTLVKGLIPHGIVPAVDSLRRLPETMRWMRAGCTGVAPAPVKRMVLSAYRNRYGLNQFVETGTHLGDTLAYMARLQSVQATSIELAEGYFQVAMQRFATYSNVSLLQGDSGRVLPAVVRRLQSPALFWLDGHYSGGDTGRAESDTPISAELAAVLESPVRGHVVLIDDARLFDGTHGYPHLDHLLETVRRRSGYDIEVSIDIVRLTPKP
jgi:hypothetical protein